MSIFELLVFAITNGLPFPVLCQKKVMYFHLSFTNFFQLMILSRIIVLQYYIHISETICMVGNNTNFITMLKLL